ncbi:hypothetical protein ABIB62_003383 [Mucilaginibacter sp. UYP25]
MEMVRNVVVMVFFTDCDNNHFLQESNCDVYTNLFNINFQ